MVSVLATMVYGKLQGLQRRWIGIQWLLYLATSVASRYEMNSGNVGVEP